MVKLEGGGASEAICSSKKALRCDDAGKKDEERGKVSSFGVRVASPTFFVLLAAMCCPFDAAVLKAVFADISLFCDSLDGQAQAFSRAPLPPTG